MGEGGGGLGEREVVGAEGGGEEGGAVLYGGDFACGEEERKGMSDFLFFFLFFFFFSLFEFYMSYIPCIIGFPVEAIELTPIHTKSPKPVFAV